MRFLPYRLSRWAREVAHRRGWLASPSLAYLGVPFGRERRDLAGEIAADLDRRCAAGECSLCGPEGYPFPEGRVPRTTSTTSGARVNTREAAEKLTALLNELGAAGVEIEAAIGGLSLSTDTEPYGARVEPVDQTRTAWEITP
jgi:hypothetical protein